MFNGQSQNAESLTAGRRLCREAYSEFRTIRREMRVLLSEKNRLFRHHPNKGMEEYIEDRFDKMKSVSREIELAIHEAEDDLENYTKACNIGEIRELIYESESKMNRIIENFSPNTVSVASTAVGSSDSSEEGVKSRQSLYNYDIDKKVGDYVLSDESKSVSSKNCPANCPSDTKIRLKDYQTM